MAFLLHQLLSESANRHPNNNAIIFNNEAITYSELESKTNNLAQALIRHGINKRECVAIYMKRGITSIIAAFGVMKMGGIYVPIDPMAPPKRFKYIVDQCNIKTIFTIQDKVKNIEGIFSDDNPFDKIYIFNVTDQFLKHRGQDNYFDCQEMTEGSEATPPSVGTIDSDLAYILFTSGSTGDPKGVMISHLNALTFVNTAHEFFDINELDRFSNISPLHFDMSVFDIFVAIKGSASIIVIPESTPLFPVKLAELIAASKITVWNSVPSALSILANLSNLNSYDFTNLRLILFAGEIFPLKYLRRLKENIKNAKYCNMYGQTEANSSTFFWVKDIPTDISESLPIGKALPNYEVFAIDENGKQIHGPGKEGELYVRSSSVAQGYLAQIDKTEECFVNNPLNSGQTEKIYRTGDLVRIDDHGNFVFCGRKDHLIKSRGYRVELGEIETVFSAIDGIKTVVIIPIPDELIGNRLYAILVPSEPCSMNRDDILQHAYRNLPTYMIPEKIEFRDGLPMTSSGKIDRQKLFESLIKKW
jgi:amino acid adenylation domain-containing protein